MLYDLLELLFGDLLIKQEKKMPKCRTCKKRMEQMGPPRLFLLCQKRPKQKLQKVIQHPSHTSLRLHGPQGFAQLVRLGDGLHDPGVLHGQLAS